METDLAFELIQSKTPRCILLFLVVLRVRASCACSHGLSTCLSVYLSISTCHVGNENMQRMESGRTWERERQAV